jgi:hypothetical protein
MLRGILKALAAGWIMKKISGLMRRRRGRDRD